MYVINDHLLMFYHLIKQSFGCFVSEKMILTIIVLAQAGAQCSKHLAFFLIIDGEVIDVSLLMCDFCHEAFQQ